MDREESTIWVIDDIADDQVVFKMADKEERRRVKIRFYGTIWGIQPLIYSMSEHRSLALAMSELLLGTEE